MSIKCSRCGRETNSPTGVCAVCTLENRFKENFPEEEIMVKVAAEKICVDCKKTFKPTSNGQKRCPDCKAEHSKMKLKARRKGTKKTYKSREIVSVATGRLAPTPSGAGFAGMVQKAQELIAEVKTKCAELERLFE